MVTYKGSLFQDEVKSIRELAKEALKEIMASEGQWKEKDFAYHVESFDFRDADYPNCNKLYVAVTQDMLHWMAHVCDSLAEIEANTSTFSGGEIAIRINEIDNRVIKAVMDQVK